MSQHEPLHEKDEQERREERGIEAENRIYEALKFLKQFGNEDGAHHKQWALDQVARLLAGDKYDEWRMSFVRKEDGRYEDYWDEGSSP